MLEEQVLREVENLDHQDQIQYFQLSHLLAVVLAGAIIREIGFQTREVRGAALEIATQEALEPQTKATPGAMAGEIMQVQAAVERVG